jgi:hypothetical protein
MQLAEVGGYYLSLVASTFDHPYGLGLGLAAIGWSYPQGGGPNVARAGWANPLPAFCENSECMAL